uniref:Cyclin N-terminal domain-containing protein n=1 Tax=Haemonchus contortus TaxID=6289 RepID=A0A7I4XUP2_HAECO
MDSFLSPYDFSTSSKIHEVPYGVARHHRLENDDGYHIAQSNYMYDFPITREVCDCFNERGNAPVGLRCYPHRHNMDYSLPMDKSSGKFSKAYYHSETKKLRQCNADPVLKTEPLYSARMPLMTGSPIISTPSLPHRGAAASVDSSLMSSNSSLRSYPADHFPYSPDDCLTVLSTGSPLEGSPIFPVPPAAYADTDEESYISAGHVLSYTQNSDGAVSGFFSQSENNSCSNSLEETSSQAKEVGCFTQSSSGHGSDFFSQSENGSTTNSSDEDSLLPTVVTDCNQHDDIGNLSLSSEVSTTCDNGTVLHLQLCDASRDDTPRRISSVVASSASSLSSPVAKRGRFGSSCAEKIPDNGAFAEETQLFDEERYHNEYAKDTYAWLSYRESTTHTLGSLFMDAQKKEGASWADRRAVVMRALVDMKKRKHTLEAIHLGIYILDKCLDSFHIAKNSLADVCAVSMVLGTKMEEYESLRPGTVGTLLGTTASKARLCDIEKRIVYEMKDGLCFPTPFLFAHYMLAELCCDDEQIRFAQYLLELALLDSQFRDEGGPRVAHAAVCMASAIAKQRDSVFVSEGDTLLEAERKLFHLTKLPIGSTRNVMRNLVHEMDRAVQEKHAVLIDYLSDDNKRICFCEVSPALWDLLCGVSRYQRESD